MKIQKSKVLCIIIIVLVIFIYASGNRGYKATVKQYVQAVMDGNAKQLVNLMPKEYANESISQGEYHNKSDMIDSYKETLDYTINAYEETFGTRWKYDYDITNVYNYSKSDVEGFLLISEYGELLPKIKGVKEVSYELIIYGDEQEESTSEKLLLVKLGRKWYIADAISE